VNDAIVLVAVVVATAAIIAHNEWRYRRMVQWLDALGEMLGEWLDSERKHKEK
jgi:hypothetical protein